MIVSTYAATAEQQELLQYYLEMLSSVSKDGGRKRASGAKPSWKIDRSHEAAIFSHLNKWKHGEQQDPDSGVHPLVHLAWRALAIAWQEGQNDSDATGYKEVLADPRSLRAHLGGGCGMEHQKVGAEGVELSDDERKALWEKAHHPTDGRGRVFIFGDTK